METWVGIIFIIVILALSITFHEFMHAYVSNRLGDDTARLSGRLSLNPLAHIDPVFTVLMPILLFMAGLPPFGAAKPAPFNPARLRNGEIGAAMVAIAGPLTNLVLAILLSIWLRVVPADGLGGAFIQLFVMVNIGFFVFNMIPFPPLDGSRVLYVIAPEPLRNIMRQIEAFGLIGIALFIFLLFPLISPVIGGVISALMNFLIPGFSLNP
jgi:Zn-dependent protease